MASTAETNDSRTAEVRVALWSKLTSDLFDGTGKIKDDDPSYAALFVGILRKMSAYDTCEKIQKHAKSLLTTHLGALRAYVEEPHKKIKKQHREF